ncbi:hypothetical protein OG2516_01611 [Oceanicola granulosus HTCC2516]|uniref:Uncharacterized protein n=1 Tax=Oceanicola granulosus (strain ATCC BAA-861 / DSM 15982 / KCTC 12143 / HTCC2516) TaxID=314256 RepID=Q2CFW7_OCEGH|nr:hypothetical protein [Oceanicola granulosus]EAR51575.1 hypothetical protein OG2516_01611 [Oceanicola granulosus HTCC2516]
MRLAALLALPLWLGGAVPGAAQELAGVTAGSRPLSAVDWLSDSLDTPRPALPGQPEPLRTAPGVGEAPVAGSASAPAVTVLPLDAVSPDLVGLVPHEVSGLPRSLWAGSEPETLAALIAAEWDEGLPAMQDLLRLLLLAETDPPRADGGEGLLFLARIDKLLDLGALDPALEMLEAAGPDRPALFRRYFDVALLTGRESRACRVLAGKPELAPTLSARIFCLAHGGDWPAAALTLNSARALEAVSAEEDALLTRFLEPETFADLPPLRRPDRPTPLDFRIREGIGEAMPTMGLPRAFAHADLRPTTGWKARLEAAERLARVGAVDDNLLLDLYTQLAPAASGSVWDRAAAVQEFEAALTGRDPDKLAAALPPAWEAMTTARTEVAFARLFGAALLERELDGPAGRLAYRIGLLSDDYESVALDHEPATAEDAFLRAVAIGEMPQEAPRGTMESAIHRGFTDAEPPARLMALADSDRLGEAILRAIALFDAGAAGDPEAVATALAFFRAVRLEETARRAALQLLLLERSP